MTSIAIPERLRQGYLNPVSQAILDDTARKPCLKTRKLIQQPGTPYLEGALIFRWDGEGEDSENFILVGAVLTL